MFTCLPLLLCRKFIENSDELATIYCTKSSDSSRGKPGLKPSSASYNLYVRAWVLSCFSCVLMVVKDCSPPGSPVHGIFQARILEWVAISSSRGPPNPRINPPSPALFCIAGGFFTTATESAHIHYEKWKMISANESRSVMSDSLRPHELYSPRNSPGQNAGDLHSAFWFPFSRGSSQPRDWTQVSCIAGGFFTS